MSVDRTGFKGGDRTDRPAGAQEKLLEALAATGKPVVLVLLNGSALAVNWARSTCPRSSRPGIRARRAAPRSPMRCSAMPNPGGSTSRDVLQIRRTATAVRRLLRWTDGRTATSRESRCIRSATASYTKFAYSDLQLDRAKTAATGAVHVGATVKNVGSRAGDEVVQLYVTDVEASVPVPIRSLQGIRRVHLAPGERREVSFTVEPRQLAIVDDSGKSVVEPGEFAVSVGGEQPGRTGRAHAASTSVVEGRFRVTGATTAAP